MNVNLTDRTRAETPADKEEEPPSCAGDNSPDLNLCIFPSRTHLMAKLYELQGYEEMGLVCCTYEHDSREFVRDLIIAGSRLSRFLIGKSQCRYLKSPTPTSHGVFYVYARRKTS